jgi:hypothetical protein
MCDHDDGFDGPDWMDIAIAGALVEEMAKEEKERQQHMKMVQEENDPDEE